VPSRQTQQIMTNTTASRAEFREAIRLFLLDCKFRNLTEETIRGYHAHLHQLQLDLEKWNVSLANIQPSDLSHRMVLHMLNSGAAAATINGRIRVCKQFFKFLYLDGKITENVAGDLKPIQIPKRFLHTFTAEQVARLLNQPDRNRVQGARDYAIMLVLLDTGMRLGELSQLNVSDVMPEEGLIIIRHGKGRRSRMIPIQKTCIEALQHYLKLRRSRESESLWVTRKKERFLRRGIMQMVKSYMIQAGITGMHGSTHIFRHTMAKFFLMNGGDIFSLQTILGHTTLEMTRYYVQLFSQDIHEKHALYSPVERLNEEFKESAVFKS